MLMTVEDEETGSVAIYSWSRDRTGVGSWYTAGGRHSALTQGPIRQIAVPLEIQQDLSALARAKGLVESENFARYPKKAEKKKEPRRKKDPSEKKSRKRKKNNLLGDFNPFAM